MCSELTHQVFIDYDINMPYRKTPFVNNEIYHVVNRGVAQKPIFLNKRNYQRFLGILNFYRFNPSLRFSYFYRLSGKEKQDFIGNLKKNKEPVIEILTFCLMPNHFHILLRQFQDKGIQIFMRNLQNSYARYFNNKHNRIGPLFQSPFKAIRIEDEEQLLHVSRYIHLNPSSSYLIEIDKLENYPWSSLSEYLGQRTPELTSPKLVLSFFESNEKYKEFVFNQADYQREFENIKHLILEK